MSKKKQAAKRFAHETLDAGYQYKDLGDNTFALVDAKGKRYNVKDAGLEANKSGIANLFTPNRRQRILNARALARAAALKGATKAEPKAFYNPQQQQQAQQYQQQQQQQQTAQQEDPNKQRKQGESVDPNKGDKGGKGGGDTPQEKNYTPKPLLMPLDIKEEEMEDPEFSPQQRMDLERHGIMKGSDYTNMALKDYATKGDRYMLVKQDDPDLNKYETLLTETGLPFSDQRVAWGLNPEHEALLNEEHGVYRTIRDGLLNQVDVPEGYTIVHNPNFKENYIPNDPNFKANMEEQRYLTPLKMIPWAFYEDKEPEKDGSMYRSGDGQNIPFYRSIVGGGEGYDLSLDAGMAAVFGVTPATAVKPLYKSGIKYGAKQVAKKGAKKLIPQMYRFGQGFGKGVGKSLWQGAKNTGLGLKNALYVDKQLAAEAAQYKKLMDASRAAETLPIYTGAEGVTSLFDEAGNVIRTFGGGDDVLALPYSGNRYSPWAQGATRAADVVSTGAETVAPSTSLVPTQLQPFNNILNTSRGTGGFAGQAAQNISSGKFAPGFKNGGQLRYGK